MDDDEIKSLGLQARAFKLARKGRQRPSNDLLYIWFVGKAQLVRKRDVQLFDAWLRSDGVAPHPSPNGLQHSIFPSGFSRYQAEPSAASVDWMIYEVNEKHWALTVAGHMELQQKAGKLPGSDL